MHDLALRALARQRVAAGEPTTKVAAELGVSQAAVWRWANRSFVSDDAMRHRCWACSDRDAAGNRSGAYAYLLGQYLGDGHLVTSSRVPVLRIYACTDYLGIFNEIVAAIDGVRDATPGLVWPKQSDRLVTVQSYWMHWPCLFPQHGPGMKHQRPIVLTDWQREIVEEHPWPLIRGLIHSDGCRAINRVVVRGKAYEYPRYFFSNESRDIHGIMGDALDRVGVEWRFNRRNCISIAKRAAVALMDRHIGPKS